MISASARHLNTPKIIGIVGGAGPFAGIDLQAKILSQTRAEKDQDFLPVITLSDPGRIPDRTAFLAGDTAENPAGAIFHQLRRLEAAGAQVAALPCNTAHAPAIDDVVRRKLARPGSTLTYLHMVQEVGDFLAAHYPPLSRVGLLATKGTVQSGVYQQTLAPAGFAVLAPDPVAQEQVQQAIYDPRSGIKALGTGAQQAYDLLAGVAAALADQGAVAFILGCTEIPVIVRETVWLNRPVIDPTLILARALIREADPGRLKPLPVAGG